jgi:DNA polymerase IIIc chi subunit
MSSVSQESLNTVPATSLANKVMIQVPVQGQSQPGATMLLISPQKHFTLGSQKSVNNVVQCVPQQSQSVQHVPVVIPNNQH